MNYSMRVTNRRKNQSYCEIEVISCEHESYWYKNLIGCRFFCRIIFCDYGYGKFIKEFVGVKLSKNKEIIFRSFDPKDVIIL